MIEQLTAELLSRLGAPKDAPEQAALWVSRYPKGTTFTLRDAAQGLQQLGRPEVVAAALETLIDDGKLESFYVVEREGRRFNDEEYPSPQKVPADLRRGVTIIPAFRVRG